MDTLTQIKILFCVSSAGLALLAAALNIGEKGGEGGKNFAVIAKRTTNAFGRFLSYVSGKIASVRIPALGKMTDDMGSAFLLLFGKGKAEGVTAAVTAAAFALGIGLTAAFCRIGQIWYVKALALILSIFLPLYLVTLLADMWRFSVYRKIPVFIDEFRGAFLAKKRIKPALIDSAKFLGAAGSIILREAQHPDFEQGLANIKAVFKNEWINTFVALLANYNRNGGDLLAQLYALNHTMTGVINTDRKRNKRLIAYEIFAVCAVAIGIPLIKWLNGAILGEMFGGAAGIQADMSMSKIILYAIFALAVIRILRKI